ncbi:MAG: hypothetical protein WCQ53_04475 [bacterium]
MKNILIAVLLLASPCIFAADYVYDFSDEMSLLPSPTPEACSADQMTKFTNYLSLKVKTIDAKYTKNAAGYYRVSTPSEALEVDELDLINKYYLSDLPENQSRKDNVCSYFVPYCNGTITDMTILNKRSNADIQKYVDEKYTSKGIWAFHCDYVDFYGYNLIACITIDNKDEACKELLAQATPKQ